LEAQALHQESIRFHSDGFTLAGTLYMPNGAGPHPAVVLFHGSGPAGRLDVPAQWFARHGVAALTYDKRGVGESSGNWHDVPFMTLCDDGLAAIQLLKARPDIDKKRIGVWGLSQGGWLGPLAASRSNDIAFVIAVSGPGVSPGEQMIFFYLRELINGGMPKAQAEEASALRREVWTYMETGQGYERAKADLERAKSAPWYSVVSRQYDDLFHTLVTPAQRAGTSRRWFQPEAIYDPKPALRKLHVPALFIFGADDQLVPVPESVRIIRETLQQSRARDFSIHTIPNTGHAMFVARGDGDRVVSEEYLKIMADWLKEHLLK